ncbi:MAG: DUF885 domain-containing protein [Proteobacteria bacterium]|nr:DUF885 domain-containing protein [Pseudomonadota bacterium]
MILVAVLALFACAQENDRSAAATSATGEAGPVDNAALLDELFEAYFEEILELNPLYATFIGDNRYNDRLANSLSPEYLETSRALERKYLAALLAIDNGDLNGQDLLSYEIFRLDRETSIAGERFPGELLPLNQTFSLANFFAVMGSGQSVQPFATVSDYENFLSRADDFIEYLDQAIINMRIGVERGVVQPRVVMEKVVPQLRAHVVDDAATSIFYGPVSNMPADFSAEDRARLTTAYTDMIENRLVPAYLRVAEFIEQEYLPATRTTVGWDALPDGEAWYAFRVEDSTTTKMSPDEIHELGLAEVARIRGEMEEVAREVGFDGTLAEFFEFLKTDPQFFFGSSEEVLAAYEAARLRIDERLPSLFSVFPKADYEIRQIEEFRARSSAGAMYQSPSPDGSRPGIFYVNTFNLKAQPTYGVETLSIHEAAPGHHFQISIQQEVTGLPRFRRFGGYTAFAEGWALYAESIGKELGVFTDPYQYYGRLNDEQLRAMRLVVDTGLHSKGWSREQVIQYMRNNSSLAETDIISEAERYIATPGQALAYKVGQINLTRMRAEAEQALGENFDIKAWHAQILTDGALPMAVLDAKNRRWIGAQK